jgi:hypothetical protein
MAADDEGEEQAGGEGEEYRAQRGAGLGASGDDPAAMAVALAAAMGLGRTDPAMAAGVLDYLTRQSRLIDLRIAQFDEDKSLIEEERRLAIGAAKRKRFADRMKYGLQVSGALAAALIGLGVLILLGDAFTSKSVVVDAFDTPPAMAAASGLTGKVVASAVLDRLQQLQDATRAATKGLKTKSAWSSDIKVQAPGTGVSIGDVERLLRERFGHDVHIGGDLVRTDAGGLALTVRGDGVPARTFEGSASELDKLAGAAAEYVYGRSQPYQYAIYLAGNHRDDDAIAFLPGAFARSTGNDERAALANAWGSALTGSNRSDLAIDKFLLAMALAPPNWKSWGNLVWSVRLARGEEAAWGEGRLMLRAVAKTPRSGGLEKRFLSGPATATMDMPLKLAAYLDDAAHNGGAGAQINIDGPAIADVHWLMHDPVSARRYMALGDPQNPITKAEALLLAGYADLDRGDSATAIAPLEGFWAAWQADPSLRNVYPDTPCFLGLAYGLAGRLAEAQAVFDRFGAWSRCAALHGDVLEHAGDLAGAERVWARGIAIAPDLGWIYLHRGVSALNRGDLPAAAADLAAANARAPHWADPLKVWGDLLARQGRWKTALAKYDAALAYAPAWSELHQARDVAARRSG